MSVVELAVGSRVRLVGSYKIDGDPREPEQPHAIVSTPTRARIFALDNGLMRRIGDGQYAIVVMAEEPPSLTVKFCSGIGVSRPSAEVAFRVVDARATLVPELVAPTVSPIVANPRRDEMIAELKARGVQVRSDESDAFVVGAFEQLQRQRRAEQTARLREHLSGGWKQTRR